jgi:serine/threonine-protein kinase HipA
MDRNCREFRAFERVHEGLPRQGPGSKDTTLRAVNLLPPLPQHARIYDLGCGPGRASLVLAKALQRKVVAVDLAESFLVQLKADAAEQGLSDLIEPRRGDMLALDDAPESINLIWAEGSIYIPGFDNALSIWRPLLVSSGLVACTELSWLTEHPSIDATRFWNDAYPAARSGTENIIAAERLGFACHHHFVLPTTCWWDEYYDPLLRNIERLTPEAHSDDALAQAIAQTTAEIDLFRRCHSEYGYVFYLFEKVVRS